MDEKLKYIYDDIYRWLAFAEAKNMGFLAVVGFVIDFLLKEREKLLLYYDIFFYIFLIWILLILLILVISFVPFLNQSSCICRQAYNTYKHMISTNQIFYINIFLTDYEQNQNPNSNEHRTVENLLGISDSIQDKFVI